MSKITIVINGKALVGKDTLCDIVIKHYNAIKVSAITPIKEIALRYGWNGEKDNKSRKFLSDLKRIFIEYNDLPNRYLLDEHEKFKNSNNDIMFVHIRESDQIDSFINNVNGRCVTLLVKKEDANVPAFFGNNSDDYVDNYVYDYYYNNNNNSLDKVECEFLEFFKIMLKSEKIEDINMKYQ